MNYAMNKSDSIPELHPKNVIGILSCADALSMENLIQECVFFIQGNLEEIVKNTNNSMQLKPHLAKRIALGISISELDNLGDEKHYLISRLYKKKLEIYFDEPDNLLKKWKLCENLYSFNGMKSTKCSANAHRYVDMNGKIFSWHVGKFVSY